MWTDIPQKRILSIFGLLLFGLGLGACNLGVKGACTPADLAQPGIVYPAYGAVIDSLSPTLQWSYTGTCPPNTFRVEMYGPARSTFADETLRTTRFDAGEIPWGTMAWRSDLALQPASMYSWRVAGILDSTVGTYSLDYLFITGPVCNESQISTLVSPNLISPPDGTVITDRVLLSGIFPTPFFSFIWDDASVCLPPNGYTVQVSTDPSFTARGTYTFTTNYLTSSIFFFPPGVDWTDCARYYWRVGQNRTGWGSGPFSTTWSFFVNTTGAEICTTFRPTYIPFITLPGIDLSPVPADTLSIVTPGVTGTASPLTTISQTPRPTSTFTYQAQPTKTYPSQSQPSKTYTPQSHPTNTPTSKFQKPQIGCLVRQKDQSLQCTVPCPQNAVPGGACTP